MTDARAACEEALRVLLSAGWISENQHTRILGGVQRRDAKLGRSGNARPEGPVVLYSRNQRGTWSRAQFDSQRECNKAVAEANGVGFKGTKHTPDHLGPMEFTRRPLAEDLPAWRELVK